MGIGRPTSQSITPRISLFLSEVEQERIAQRIVPDAVRPLH